MPGTRPAAPGPRRSTGRGTASAGHARHVAQQSCDSRGGDGEIALMRARAAGIADAQRDRPVRPASPAARRGRPRGWPRRSRSAAHRPGGPGDAPARASSCVGQVTRSQARSERAILVKNACVSYSEKRCERMPSMISTVAISGRNIRSSTSNTTSAALFVGDGDDALDVRAVRHAPQHHQAYAGEVLRADRARMHPVRIEAGLPGRRHVAFHPIDVTGGVILAADEQQAWRPRRRRRCLVGRLRLRHRRCGRWRGKGRLRAAAHTAQGCGHAPARRCQHVRPRLLQRAGMRARPGQGRFGRLGAGLLGCQRGLRLGQLCSMRRQLGGAFGQIAVRARDTSWRARARLARTPRCVSVSAFHIGNSRFTSACAALPPILRGGQIGLNPGQGCRHVGLPLPRQLHVTRGDPALPPQQGRSARVSC